jgi:hypothetical protein
MNAEAIVVVIAVVLLALPIMDLCIGHIRHKIAKKKAEEAHAKQHGKQQ